MFSGKEEPKEITSTVTTTVSTAANGVQLQGKIHSESHLNT